MRHTEMKIMKQELIKEKSDIWQFYKIGSDG